MNNFNVNYTELDDRTVAEDNSLIICKKKTVACGNSNPSGYRIHQEKKPHGYTFCSSSTEWGCSIATCGYVD